LSTQESTVKPHVEYDLTRLHELIDNFKLTNVWKVMENTVENSPWHREKNVAVHTEMTMSEAAKHFPRPADGRELTYLDRRHIVLVSLALLFHDTGKPTAEVVKESEDRGVYRSYAGHEQDSARTFEDYVVTNWDQFESLITVWDVYVITWMIEHHLPYGLKQKDKVLALDKSLIMTFLPNGPEVFFNMLKGDTGGRISDAYETNYQKMLDWIDERQAVMEQIGPLVFAQNEHMNNMADTPEMVMLIGPSGAGKSTLRRALAGYEEFSLDTLRLQFAVGNVDVVKGIGPLADKATYRIAYQYAVDNEQEFDKYVDAHLNHMFRNHKYIVIDNTNTGAKRRKRYLEMARQRGMRTTALYIPAALDQLVKRQETRNDKTIPAGAVAAQFASVAVPSFGGEFDAVNIAPHNFGAKE
jgi:predicted kinase